MDQEYRALPTGRPLRIDISWPGEPVGELGHSNEERSAKHACLGKHLCRKSASATRTSGASHLHPHLRPSRQSRRGSRDPVAVRPFPAPLYGGIFSVETLRHLRSVFLSFGYSFTVKTAPCE